MYRVQKQNIVKYQQRNNIVCPLDTASTFVTHLAGRGTTYLNVVLISGEAKTTSMQRLTLPSLPSLVTVSILL